MSFRRLRVVGATAAVAALLLAGCSSDNGGGTTGGSGSDGEIIFVDALGSNPPHLNVQLNTDVATGSVGSAMFEPLLKLDADYQIYPLLATEWEVSEDATEYTLKLREDVKWHDGEPFTAADVKFNLDEVVPLHPLGATLANVHQSVEVVDEFTVRITLTEPFAPYLEGLTGQRMIPAHIYEGTDIVTNPANAEPIGTGPFMIDEFVEGSHVQVVRFDDYWGDITNIDKIIFQILPDANSRVLALRSGEVDRIAPTFLDAAQVGTLRDDANLLLTPPATSPTTMTLFFNSENGPTADAAVRTALYTAMDRQAIADNAYYGMATPPRGPIPAEISWAADPETDFNEQFAFDPEAAAAALDAAGFPAGADGKRFEINIRTAPFADYVATAEVIKSNLEDIGVGVNIMSEDLNVFVDQVYTQHNFDMAIMSFAAYEDPSLGVSRLYVCNAESIAFRNPTLMCDTSLDEAFAAATATSVREERAAAFAQAERRVAELLHTVPLVDDQAEMVIRQDRWTNIDEYQALIGYDWSKLRAAE